MRAQSIFFRRKSNPFRENEDANESKNSTTAAETALSVENTEGVIGLRLARSSRMAH